MNLKQYGCRHCTIRSWLNSAVFGFFWYISCACCKAWYISQTATQCGLLSVYGIFERLPWKNQPPGANTFVFMPFHSRQNTGRHSTGPVVDAKDWCRHALSRSRLLLDLSLALWTTSGCPLLLGWHYNCPWLKSRVCMECPEKCIVPYSTEC